MSLIVVGNSVDMDQDKLKRSGAQVRMLGWRAPREVGGKSLDGSGMTIFS